MLALLVARNCASSFDSVVPGPDAKEQEEVHLNACLGLFRVVDYMSRMGR